MPAEIAVGQIVEVTADARAQMPTLPRGSFAVAEVVGENENAMVKVRDGDGTIFKWFRATDLLISTPKKETPMSASATEELNALMLSTAKERNISLKAVASIAV